MTSTARAEMKRNFVLEKLLNAGVTISQQGEDIYLLDYEELKYEFVLLGFREAEQIGRNQSGL